MSEEQQKLVSVLDSVHNKLRRGKRQAKDGEEWRKMWEEHTADLRTLQGYSAAMHQLATKIWDPRNAVMGAGDDKATTSEPLDKRGDKLKLKCRLEWVVSRCEEYFQVRRRDFQTAVPAETIRLKLLDVGSCYNPFSKFENYFDITALDLCPAPGFEGSVFQCDFLGLEVIDQAEIEKGQILAKDKEGAGFVRLTKLAKGSFDVIVFSYFLEYLADPEQRVDCCNKAFNLLKPNGLLFVLRPDSNRVTPGGNSVLVKRMKLGMVMLGFKRIYFEKLEHLWCMAFKRLEEGDDRKLALEGPYFKRDIAKAGVEHALEDPTRIHELFQISQDFKEFLEGEDEEVLKHSEEGLVGSGSQEDSKFSKELLDELVGSHSPPDSDNSEVY